VTERLTIQLQTGKCVRGGVRRVHPKMVTRTAREETVLTEDRYGIYEEQANVKYASEEKHD
jgi:hypothetical protein